MVIGATTGAGCLVSTLLDFALAHRLTLLADALTALVGALLLGSLGLQVRIPLLLVPAAPLQPLAVLGSTLAGYVGEFSGPLIAGALKDRLAGRCAVVEDGEVDPRCATSATDQHGLLMVVVSTQLMALAGASCWAAASLVTKPMPAAEEIHERRGDLL